MRKRSITRDAAMFLIGAFTVGAMTIGASVEAKTTTNPYVRHIRLVVESRGSIEANRRWMEGLPQVDRAWVQSVDAWITALCDHFKADPRQCGI